MRYLLSLLLLSVFVKLDAQVDQPAEPLPIDTTRDNVLERANNFLTKRYQRKNFDTAYLERPPYSFTVKLRANFSGSGIETHGLYEGDTYLTNLETPNRITASVGLSYRGVSIGFALNPGKLSGRDKDMEFNIAFYANRYGVDAAYQDARTYKGWSEVNGLRQTIPADLLHSRLLSASAYYVFNYRRFSYPAAFTQSYIQRRSAGSPMLALILLGGEIEGHTEEAGEQSSMKIRIGNLGLGGGYGYNWVLPHRWMIHGSALPAFVVASINRLTIDNEQQKMPYSFPELMLTERIAITHAFNSQHFLALNFVITHSLFGNPNRLRISYNKWRLRLCYGFRF